ncbi:MAG TPA: alpha/beta hydrolase-fold protein [Puia sp.]|nr:alpha/beta hydrolase-fold protein [Puia sp.]
MKRLCTCLLVLTLYSNHTRSQTPPDSSIHIGKAEEFYSKTLGEKRRLMVYLPGSYYDTYFYQRRYPVVYLLDGDTHFFSVASMVKQMSEDGNGLLFPEMIVVAIPSTDRRRDLTPTRDTTGPRMGRGSDNHSGGGEKFLSFLSDDLIPHIDSLYPTTPYRVFIGHSLGGLIVVHALIHHPQLFSGYLAIDPSIWWNKALLLRQSREVLPAADLRGHSLFIAGANNLQNGLDTTTVMNDSISDFSQHMRGIFNIRNTFIKTTNRNHLAFGWKYYPEYSHNSVPLVAEYDGLRSIFDFYPLDFPHETFEDPGFKADTLLPNHYAEISRRMGYTVSPPEVFVNNIGYSLMQHHLLDRAWYYFNLNVQNYPKSFNVYDSMGDLYLAKGEKAKAIESFTKSLSLRETPGTRKKLDKLQKGE